MTLEEIKNLDRDFLTPAQAASVMGCDPNVIRVKARDGLPLPFPVMRSGNRTKIPRAAFIRFMEGA